MATKIRPTIRGQRAIYVVTDWFTTSIAFFCFNIFRFYFMNIAAEYVNVMEYLFSTKLILEQIFVPVFLLLVYWVSGYYNRPLDRSRLNDFLTTLYTQLFNTALIYLFALTNDIMYLRRDTWFLIIILFLLLFIFNYAGRFIVTENMWNRLQRSAFKYKTVIIGSLQDAIKIATESEKSKSKPGLAVVGYLDGTDSGTEKISQDKHGIRKIDSLAQLESLCRNHEVEQVIIIPHSEQNANTQVLNLLYQLYPYNISIKIQPDILSLLTPSIRTEDILSEPFIDITSAKVGEFSKNVKRTLDVAISALSLIVLFPLLLGIIISIKLSDKGDIFYTQERIGRHKKPFKMYKFRSMVEDAEKGGKPMLTEDDDPRITGIGRWMRKYRLDELPQFWNVIKGDMSLVGPRPERSYFIDQIVEKAPWYTLVLQVRPGITSWGMVKYGYADSIEGMIERNRYDLIYLSNISVAVDFKILLHTINTVSSGKGK